MFGRFFRNKNKDLSERCRQYLEVGPPEHMEDYVPESLTEIIIAHGAKEQKLDDELLEVASIILMESSDFSDIADKEIQQYMARGAELVEEVMACQ